MSMEDLAGAVAEMLAISFVRWLFGLGAAAWLALVLYNFRNREPYPTWYRRFPVGVYMPWRNLGCLGFKAGRYYVDLYSRQERRWLGWRRFIPGMFWTNGRERRWFSLGTGRLKAQEEWLGR